MNHPADASSPSQQDLQNLGFEKSFMNFPRGSTWGWFSLEEPISDEDFEKIKDAKLQAGGELQWSRVTGELIPESKSYPILRFLQATRKSSSGPPERRSRESLPSSRPTRRTHSGQNSRVIVADVDEVAGVDSVVDVEGVAGVPTGEEAVEAQGEVKAAITDRARHHRRQRTRRLR